MRSVSEKTAKVLEYLQVHDSGDGVSIAEIAEALGLKEANIRPIVTIALKRRELKDGTVNEAFCTYEKREVEGIEKPVGYAVLTEAGKNFDLTAEGAIKQS